MCRGGGGGGVGRVMTVPATITEQTKILRSTNKAHGKLTGVNLVLHQHFSMISVYYTWHKYNITVPFQRWVLIQPVLLS